MSKKKATWLDGILGSQLRDTQGETLDVAGADISELEAGRGRWNDNHGKGFYNSIGRITEAKKIFKEEDCENDRHRYYWDKIKAPYIYGSGYLYDDEGHPNARAAAAILRNIHKSDAPLKLKLSVEGGVIARGIKDPSILARTKIHSCAVTFTPANNATLVEPINLDKSYHDSVADMELIKSVMHLAQTNVPSFRHVERHAAAGKVLNNIEQIRDLAKRLGISESDIPLLSRDDLIKNSVEAKILGNVQKINEMMKGAMKRFPTKNTPHPHKVAIHQVKDRHTGEVTPVNFSKPLDKSDFSGSTKDVHPKALSALKLDKDTPEVMMHHVKLHQAAALKATNPDTRVYHNKHAVDIHAHVTGLNKAMMAGYGGAGVPTGATGGSVIQSESLDDGRKMKHVACDDCGKEQVYHKYQVKCRHCNKSFPLEKLYGLVVLK